MNRGLYNLDEVRYDYFRDRSLELEALLRAQSTSARSSPRRTGPRATTSPWCATARVKLLTIPDERPSGAQGFFINTRREEVQRSARAPSARARVRFRVEQPAISFMDSTTHGELLRELGYEGAGPPSPEELALLEPFRDKLPPRFSASPFHRP